MHHGIQWEAFDWSLHVLPFGLLLNRFQSLSVMSLGGVAVQMAGG
jgi:hypothetical protein